MSALVSMELKRAFANRMFCVALGIGLCLALAQLVVVVVPYGVGDGWEVWRVGTKGSYPFSVYNSWMGATSYSVFTSLYYFILPLVVCLPFADSLYTDIKSGYVVNVVSRSGKARYFGAKVIAVCLSAGVVAIVPLVANFLASALFVPLLMPEVVAGTFPVSPRAMMADIFYTEPLIYVGFYWVLTFVVSGIVACLCLVFTPLLANRFMVLVAPFLCSAIAFFTLVGSGLAGYSPINVVFPVQVYHVQAIWILVVYGTVAVVCFVSIVQFARSYEAL